MGKLSRLFGALLCFLFFSASAFAEPTVESLAALGIPTISKVLTGSHTNLYETLPEFDPKTEFLFHFYPDGHAVFYSGGDFRESGEEVAREGLRAIHNGVSVKVTVGEEKVLKINEAMKTVKFANSRNLYTCQQFLLYMLQEVGVNMKDGPHLLGSSTYRSMLEKGFIDEAGKPYPHSVVVLQAEGLDLIPATYNVMGVYEIGRQHGFFDGVRARLTYGNAELLADVQSTTKNPLINSWATNFTTGGPLTEQEMKLAHSVVQAGEKKFLDKLRAIYSGMELSALYAFYSRTDLSAEQFEAARTLFRQSMQEAIAEKVAEIEPVAANLCTNVAGAAAP